MSRIIHNLNYINEKCDKYNINFTHFKMNDDLLYLIMNYDLYEDGTNLLDSLNDMLSPKDFQNILECNPDLFLLSERDAEIIVERCLFNFNDDYKFNDLLSSELYYYRKSNYDKKDEEMLVNEQFKYIDLNLDIYPEFNVEEMLTSSFISSNDASELFKAYNSRNEQIYKLDKLLEKLTNTNNLSNL